ncbi:copia protein [Tanacetum coccineum]
MAGLNFANSHNMVAYLEKSTKNDDFAEIVDFPECYPIEPITVPSPSQPKKTHRPRKAKRVTEISQSSGPIPLFADETVTKEREDKMERTATTASSLKAEQDSARKIASLKKRVKKMERKRKSKTSEMSLFKISTSGRRILGEEDASKQGRNLKQGKQSSIFEESDFDDDGFDANMDEVFKDVKGDAEHGD